MNAKKYIYLSIGILAVFLTAIFFYFYMQFNKQSPLASYIPKDAETVVYLNSKTLLKLFIKNRNDTSFKGFDTKYKDYFTNIKDPKNNGIDFLKDAIFIEKKQKKYVLIMLKNEDVFKQNIINVKAGLFTEIEQKDGFQKVFSLRDSFTICWTKKLMCFIPKQAENFSDDEIETLFSLDEKENFSTQSNYKNIQNNEALFWFYKKNADIKINKKETLKGYINFQDSLTIIATDNIENPYADSIYIENNFNGNNFIIVKEGNDFLNKTLKDWTKIMLPEAHKKIENVDLKTYKKLIYTKGKKVIENKSITYEYDDDFNKQKIEKITYDTINEAGLIAQKLDKSDIIKISNSNVEIFDWSKVPDETKFYMQINQDFMYDFYKTNTNFTISLIHQNQQNHNNYKLIIKTENFKSLLGTFSNNTFDF